MILRLVARSHLSNFKINKVYKRNLEIWHGLIVLDINKNCEFINKILDVFLPIIVYLV